MPVSRLPPNCPLLIPSYGHHNTKAKHILIFFMLFCYAMFYFYFALWYWYKREYGLEKTDSDLLLWSFYKVNIRAKNYWYKNYSNIFFLFFGDTKFMFNTRKKILFESLEVLKMFNNSFESKQMLKSCSITERKPVLMTWRC